jgi:hypothetical protein
MNVPLIPRDKANHYFYGTVLATASYVIAMALLFAGVYFLPDIVSACELWPVPLLSPLFGPAIFGAFKEWKDSRDADGDGKPDATPEFADFVYTVAGAGPIIASVGVMQAFILVSI